MNEKDARKILRDFKKGKYDGTSAVCEAKGYLAGIEAERERVRPLLAYVDHTGHCDRFYDNMTCNCGLDNVRAAYTSSQAGNCPGCDVQLGEHHKADCPMAAPK